MKLTVLSTISDKNLHLADISLDTSSDWPADGQLHFMVDFTAIQSCLLQCSLNALPSIKSFHTLHTVGIHWQSAYEQTDTQNTHKQPTIVQLLSRSADGHQKVQKWSSVTCPSRVHLS